MSTAKKWFIASLLALGAGGCVVAGALLIGLHEPVGGTGLIVFAALNLAGVAIID